MLTNVGVARIKRLIAAARKLPAEAEKHFSMRFWYMHDGGFRKPHGRKGKTITQKDLLDCGSVACMAGWAATMPYFKRLGLKWDLLRGQRGDLPEFFISAKTINKIFPSEPSTLEGVDAYKRFFDSHIPVKSPKEWADYAENELKKLEGV